jgi:hypothetical protein
MMENMENSLNFLKIAEAAHPPLDSLIGLIGRSPLTALHSIINPINANIRQRHITILNLKLKGN